MLLRSYNSSNALIFKGMNEEDIIENARDGDPYALEYIINKYRGVVIGKARTYFLIGADKEDIIQEGMIGLYKAIRDFDRDKLTSFRAFADVCITRQIITAIKTATRQKHMPLNSYISLNKPIFEDESERTLMDIVDGNRITDPMEVFINREIVSNMENKILEVLTDLEFEVLNHYIEGKSYQEISRDLQRDIKSIDNALQRVKKKLEKCFNN